ncbi:MAG: Undecaprenyl diphosphate synthase, partial [uncultured Solirubrobacteraceae bacterium]
ERLSRRGRSSRRHHHGRKRPLGAAPRAVGRRRTPGRSRQRQGAPARRRRPRSARAHRLLVLHRELEPPGGRGRRADGALLRAHPARDAGAARPGRAHALHRAPRGRLARARRADGLGADRDLRKPAHHAVRGLQLRRPRRDRRRRALLHRHHRGGVPPAPVRAGDARSRSPDPHQRRAAPLELPALAVGLQRARLHRRAVAGLLARRLRGGARAVRQPRPALRRAL